MSTEQVQSSRSVKLAAFFDILPLSIAVIPWGILCGSLAIQVGLSPLQSQLMSLLVFAGAAQLSALTLVGASGGIATILGSIEPLRKEVATLQEAGRASEQQLAELTAQGKELRVIKSCNASRVLGRWN